MGSNSGGDNDKKQKADSENTPLVLQVKNNDIK